MFDKILEKLKKQREDLAKTSGGNTSIISDRTLEDLARTYESLISSDEVLEKTDFSRSINSIAGNMLNHSSMSVKEFEKTFKKKTEKGEGTGTQTGTPTGTGTPPAQGAPTGTGTPPAQGTPTTSSTDTMPSWADKILKGFEVITKEVTSLRNEKTASSRIERLKGELKDLPGYFTDPLLKNFGRITFEDDDEFNEYLEDVKRNKDTFVQASKEKGIVFGTPAPPKPEEKTGESSILHDASKILDDYNEKKKTKEN